MKKMALFLLTFFFITSICFAESEVYNFAKTYIDGLQLLAINVEKGRMLSPENFNNDIDASIALLSENRRAMDRITDAQNLFIKFEESTSPLIAEAAKLVINAYKIQNNIYKRQLEINEKLFGEQGLNENQYVIEMGKLQADSERAWEMLNYCSVLLTHCLVDEKPDDYGHMSYLAITSNEREKLIQQLESVYGDSVKNGMKTGQTSFELCGTILYTFLNGDHKSTDAR